MNDTLKIPTNSSLYNIKAIYNALIDEISKSGFRNLITNPLCEEIIVSNGSPELASWESTIPVLTKPWIFADGDYVRQSLDKLESDSVYTIVLDYVVNENIVLALNSGPGCDVYNLDGTINPRIMIPVVLDEFNQPTRNQVTISFRTGAKNSALGQPKVRFTSQSMIAAQLTVYSISCYEGTIGFTGTTREPIFASYVKYVDATTHGFYAVSSDGTNYYRILTGDPTGWSGVEEILSVSFFTKTDTDARYIRKDAADIASGKITFQSGLRSNGDLEVGQNKKIRHLGDTIDVCADQTTGTPVKSFNIRVLRGNLPSAGIRYNEAIDRWQFTHDGVDWKMFGTGDGTSVGGGGNSELEYFAEILDKSGFKFAVYDLFEDPETVLYPSASFNAAEGYFYGALTDTAPFIVMTKNIWPAEHVGTVQSFFVSALTNMLDNTGVTMWYSKSSPNSPYPPDQTSGLWTAVTKEEIVDSDQTTSELYLKFQIDSTSVNFYSYGVFYGSWSYNYSTVTKMREVYVVPSDMTSGSLLVAPNSAAYTADGKSLELYVNRVRQIVNVDYAEVDQNTVQMLLPLETGDYVEWYERYGYVDISADNSAALAAHITDPNAHVNDGTVAQIGWTKLPNGLIMQWGTIDTSADTTVVTFPYQFPNAVFSVVVTPTEDYTGTVEQANVSGKTTSQFTLSTFSDAVAGPIGFVDWYAIGN